MISEAAHGFPPSLPSHANAHRLAITVMIPTSSVFNFLAGKGPEGGVNAARRLKPAREFGKWRKNGDGSVRRFAIQLLGGNDNDSRENGPFHFRSSDAGVVLRTSS